MSVGWRVDLEGLEGLLLLLLLPHVFERPHVVQTVGELDDDDADVLRHGDEHLADVLRLLLFVSRQRDFAEFGDAVDELGDLIAEDVPDVVQGDIGVFHGVVQDGGDDGLVIHAEIEQDARDRDRMHDVRLSGITALVFMGLRSELVGRLSGITALVFMGLRSELVGLHYHVPFFLRVGLRHQLPKFVEPVIVFECLFAGFHRITLLRSVSEGRERRKDRLWSPGPGCGCVLHRPS